MPDQEEPTGPTVVDREEPTPVEVELPPRFVMRRILGRGGMGVVVEVLDRNLGREVAVKVLAANRRDDPSNRLRFLREAKAAAVLRHPNIVTVHDVDPERDLIVMELIHGESLQARLRREERLHPGEVRRIGLALLDALAAAHDAGIIHRDVKPGNILLDGDDAVKLVDFGVASFGDRDLTTSGVSIGTPAYMAPEQLRGRVADARADLYGVGATLFEAAAGMKLHAAESTARDIAGTVLQATGDAALASAIERAVAERPEDRFADARAFAAALVTPPPPEPPPRPPVRRRLRLALLGAGLGLVAAAGAVAIVVGTRSGDRPVVVAAPDADERTIAVLPFTDRTGEPRLDFAASGLAHILGTALEDIPGLRVVGYYDLLDRLSDPDAPAAEWIAAAGALGADVVVRGELSADPAGVRMVVEIASVTGKALGRVERRSAVDDVPAVARAAAADVARTVLGRHTPSIAGESRRFDVDRDLQLAIAAIERQDFAAAGDFLQRVELSAPELAEAHYYRALLNWWLSGDVAGPATLALGGSLDEAQRGFLEGLLVLIREDDQAIAASRFRDLAARFPGHRDIEYGLFEALFHGGHPADAMVVYRQLVEQHPRFRLGIKHALSYYVGHADEEGMTWALARLDPGAAETVLWQARAMVARRDYDAAIALLRRHDGAEVERELAEVYVLDGELELAADIAAGWVTTDVPHHAADLLGLAKARGRADDVRVWSRQAVNAAELATGQDLRDRGWVELAAVELPDAPAARLRAIRDGLASETRINVVLAKVLIAGALGDHDAVEAARSSAYPEVAAVAEAHHAERAEDWAGAARAWRNAAASAADGIYLIVEWLGAARAAQAAGDRDGLLAACDEVIRPRRFSWAWGGAAAACRRWTASRPPGSPPTDGGGR